MHKNEGEGGKSLGTLFKQLKLIEIHCLYNFKVIVQSSTNLKEFNHLRTILARSFFKKLSINSPFLIRISIESIIVASHIESTSTHEIELEQLYRKEFKSQNNS